MFPPSTSPEFLEKLNWLFGLQRLGIKVGLEHTIKLLEKCGNPQDNFPAVHIAGTNGKGSTSAMTAAIFQAAGLKVGLYTSPHLIRFNERIRVNGHPISDGEIVSFIQKHRLDIEAIESTFFETTTALAFSHFARENVDVAVIETGLGGRLDSTNVLKPQVTAITPIALDHREILGRDIISIAKEKAGIIKDKTPIVLAPQIETVSREIQNIALARKAPLVNVKSFSKDRVTLTQFGLNFSFQNRKFTTPLIGEHQALNGAIAIQIANQFDGTITDQQIKKGLESVEWPGRLQRMDSDFPIYYDVAHNAQGLHFVNRTMVNIFSRKPAALFVMKGDKEIDLVASALRNNFNPLIISGAPERGLLGGKELGDKLKDHGLSTPFTVEENFHSALKKLIEIVKSGEKPGLILGSHYIAQDVFEAFNFSFTNGEI